MVESCAGGAINTSTTCSWLSASVSGMYAEWDGRVYATSGRWT